MDVTYATHNGLGVLPETYTLLQRMFGPLCGLDKGIGFNLHGMHEPHFLMAAADLTGVHVLRDEPSPRTGVYHIGGSGITREEVLIRVLGETVERYAQLIADVSEQHTLRISTRDELIASGECVIAGEKLHFYAAQQYAEPGFPFYPFDDNMPIGWVRAASLIDNQPIWAPAQLVLVGYRTREAAGERTILPAVTTGTAAHTSAIRALRSALLEIIQIDAAMGHWYSSRTAPRITLDARTRSIERVLRQQFDLNAPEPEFYWLESPDLPAFAIACVIRGNPTPAVAVGLGCDLTLEDAMYRALLEAVAVVQLAKVVSFYDSVDRQMGVAEPVDPTRILDLDRNVAYYALPERATYVDTKFDRSSTLPASTLPADEILSAEQAVPHLIDAFRTTGKELVLVDLTTDDIRDLGFSVMRPWSPDTISLCLPSAPPLNHRRFDAYGGARHVRPHPYP